MTAPVAAKRVGRFVAFVPAYCTLSRKTRRVVRQSDADFLYGDSLHPTNDKHEEPIHVYRPGWSPERLRGHCYVGDVILATTQVVESAGGAAFLCTLSPHDRALRLAEHARRHRHVPTFLYSSAWQHRFANVDLAAVQSHCSRTGIDAECRLAPDHSAVHVIRRRTTQPSVCVIVPTRGTTAEVWGTKRVLAAEAIASFRTRSGYRPVEFVAVVDSDTPSTAIAAMQTAGGDAIRFVEYNRPFNFAEKINLAAAQTDADYLLLLNDDTEVVSPDLLETMLSYFEDPEVGMVGPMLLYEDGTIQSAGHFFNPVPYDYYRGYPADCAGAYNMLRVAREVSSVIAACALTPRALFTQAGGLCTKFPGNYNDIDYALKLQWLGKRVIWTPLASCHHFESKTREPVMKPVDVAALGARWRDKLEHDPYSHDALQRYQPIWKSNRPGQRSLDEAVGPTAPIASK
jgi:GT2 family glycosyltransferase